MSAVSDAISKLQNLIDNNLKEDEFTTVEFAEGMGITLKKAYRMLAASGVFTYRLGNVNGRQVSIWKEKK